MVFNLSTNYPPQSLNQYFLVFTSFWSVIGFFLLQSKQKGLLINLALLSLWKMPGCRLTTSRPSAAVKLVYFSTSVYISVLLVSNLYMVYVTDPLVVISCRCDLCISTPRALGEGRYMNNLPRS